MYRKEIASNRHRTIRLGITSLAVVLALATSATVASAGSHGWHRGRSRAPHHTVGRGQYYRGAVAPAALVASRPRYVYRRSVPTYRGARLAHYSGYRGAYYPTSAYSRYYGPAPAYTYNGGYYGYRTRGRHSAGREVLNVAAGVGIGAVAGGLLGGKKGAAIGALVGGAGAAAVTHLPRRSRYPYGYTRW